MNRSKSEAFVFFSALFTLSCGLNLPPEIQQTPRPFFSQALFELTPLDLKFNQEAIRHRFLMVVYFHQLDCQTCVNRELEHLKRFFLEVEDKMGFILVTFDPVWTMLQGPSPYFQSLKRVGYIKYPVFFENFQGEGYLGDQFSIILIDRNSSQILLEYFPHPDRTHWPIFEKKVRDLADLGK